MTHRTINTKAVKRMGRTALALVVASLSLRAWGIMLGAGILGFTQVGFWDAAALALIHTFMLATTSKVEVKR